MRTAPLLLVPLLLLGCQDKSIGLGAGSPVDARFIADLYTWECQTDDTGGSILEEWEGVFGYKLSLEYAPDNLVKRAIPSSGCTADLDLFPVDAGGGGHDLSAAPSWENADLSGTLTRRSDGFYDEDAFSNQSSCQRADELLGEGTLLSSADSFSGVRTPAPGAFSDVTLSTTVDENSGLPFGADITLEWETEGWDESWFQLRREDASGALVESVTCNTTGEDSYLIDSSVWGLFDGAIETPVTNLYVAVQSGKTSTASDGQKIETVTRAMHVAVVAD